jgi:hypothetical protein
MTVVKRKDLIFDFRADGSAGAGPVRSAEGTARRDREKHRCREARRFLGAIVGLDGHHNSGPGAGVGRRWMWDNRKTLFPRTALMINAEHPSTLQTTVRPTYYQGDDRIVWSNTYMLQQVRGWSVAARARNHRAQRLSRVWRQHVPRSQPAAAGRRPPRVLPRRAGRGHERVLPLLSHRPGNRDTVPWTGLEATTRAYAKIIDEVNKLPLSDLQRPEAP